MIDQESWSVKQYHELYIEHGQDKVMPKGDNKFDLPIEEQTQERFIGDDPDECAAYAQAGFDYFVFQIPWCEVDDAANERCIELMGTEAFPLVRRLLARA